MGVHIFRKAKVNTNYWQEKKKLKNLTILFQKFLISYIYGFLENP